ncbi:MAG: hypothetical protein NVSMB23_21280 [Myxococcales bacterium]
MLGIRGLLPAFAAVVCAAACPPARGQTELLPLSGGSAPAALPGVPFRPQGYAVGVYRSPLPVQADDAPSSELEEAWRAVAAAAPNVASAIFLSSPQGCVAADDACLARAAAAQRLDLLLVGALSGAGPSAALEVRLLGVASATRLAQVQQAVGTPERAELLAWAESLGCALLIPGGCRGTALVDLDLPEMQLIVDGAPQPRAGEGETPVRLTLPVGPHRVRVGVGQATSAERTLAVLREPDEGVALYARRFEPGGVSLLARGDLPLGLDGAAVAPRSQRPAPAHAPWVRPATYAAAGLGALALGLGGYELQRGRSLSNDAAAAYDRNGGYYRPSDLATVRASRSATAAGKLSGLAGLGLLAASAVLVFAF